MPKRQPLKLPAIFKALTRPNLAALLAVLLVLLNGCNQRTNGPVVRFIDVGIDEHSFPTGIGVKIENKGDAVAKLSTAKAHVRWKYLISGRVPIDQLPPQFEFDLVPNEVNPIEPGTYQVLVFDFVWKVADDMPPMFAVVHADISLQFADGQEVITIPLTLVIRSRPGIAFELPPGDESHRLAATMASLPGWKSPAAQSLIDAGK
jgi:hypothetical protein